MRLDRGAESVCMAAMKIMVLLALAALVAAGAGCVKTVAGGSTFAVPFVKDRMPGRYERPVEQVFEAAKEVITYNGTLLQSSTHYEANATRSVVGKVNQRSVWVRIEAIDPKTTEVTVQARTTAGGTDLTLVHELEKQIALKLR